MKRKGMTKRIAAAVLAATITFTSFDGMDIVKAAEVATEVTATEEAATEVTEVTTEATETVATEETASTELEVTELSAEEIEEVVADQEVESTGVESSEAADLAINTDGVRDTINATTTVRWYKFTTPVGANFYYVHFANLSDTGKGRIGLNIFSSADELAKDCILKVGNWDNGLYPKDAQDYNMQVKNGTNKIVGGHTYYAKVYGQDENTDGPFRLSVTSVADAVAADTVDEAIDKAVGTTVTGAVEDYTDVDWYKFTTDDTDSFYEFTFKNTDSEGRINFEVYSNIDLLDKDRIVQVGNWNNGLDKAKTETHNSGKLDHNHTYYVKVFGTDNDTVGNYQFDVTKTVDAISADTATAAVKVNVGTKVTDTLENDLDVDWFTFTTDSSDSFYTFDTTNVDGTEKIKFEIYGDIDATQEVCRVGDWKAGIDSKKTATYYLRKLTPNHTYYVKILPNNGARGTYAYTVNQYKDDVKDTAAEAKSVELNTTYSKFAIQDETDVDFFKFTTSDFEKYSLYMANTSVDGDVYFQIYSGKDCLDNQKVVDVRYDKKKSATTSVKLKRFKTYYVKVTANKTGKYKFAMKATAPASAKVKKAAAKKVKVSWKKVSRATGYIIERSDNKGKTYKVIKTVKKSGTVSYTDGKKLKKGKTYFYRVKAYKKIGKKMYYSAYSSVKSIKIK